MRMVLVLVRRRCCTNILNRLRQLFIYCNSIGMHRRLDSRRRLLL
jgi:hypothetical protein